MTGPDVGRLREAIAGFTVDAVYGVLGEAAWRALARNETTPGLRATTDGSALSTLIRLFQLQAVVPRTHAEAAFGAAWESARSLGLVEVDGDDARALLDLRPYGDEEHDWWVVCDLTPGLDGRENPRDPSYVLGISEASSSLAQLTVRPDVGRALDLGTGCGVQALHLATHAREVVATDVNARAVRLARLTAALNGIDVDVRDGSLFDPVEGERFDLISTNPPFVVSPPEGDRLVYRETGFPGDEVVRRIVTQADAHLNDGGWCQVLAAWIHEDGVPWQERLGAWIEPTGLDAWVVQRERVDLPEYAEMWLADAGLRHGAGHRERYDRWLTWFAEQRIEAMGFGWITLRRAGRAVPQVRIEEYTGPVAQPVGPEFAAWAERADALDAGDVLDRRWRVGADVVQETAGPVGAPDPAVIRAVRMSGLRTSRQLDTIEAGLLSASDGDLTAGQILDAISQLLDQDAAQVRSTYAPIVTDLVADGFLTA
ncbi:MULTISPECIES: class I SAM-dependent methyltransferase [Aeromicrobium]|uniref:class I SAM-dependent methyltransferase n=1 Tax=Aeromicrobium TaxID=2040 RepID=UPI00257DCED1|nr:MULTISPECIES: class I SAM-dependent methyltransferase [Aeromicrobium]